MDGTIIKGALTHSRLCIWCIRRYMKGWKRKEHHNYKGKMILELGASCRWNLRVSCGCGYELWLRIWAVVAGYCGAWVVTYRYSCKRTLTRKDSTITWKATYVPSHLRRNTQHQYNQLVPAAQYSRVLYLLSSHTNNTMRYYSYYYYSNSYHNCGLEFYFCQVECVHYKPWIPVIIVSNRFCFTDEK